VVFDYLDTAGIPPGMLAIPVSRAAARAWAAGQIDNARLLLQAPLEPEAVFVASLANRRQWRALLAQIAGWLDAGASEMICHTRNATLLTHLWAAGARLTYQEPQEGGWRLWAGQDALAAYFGRLSLRAASRTSGADPRPAGCKPLAKPANLAPSIATWLDQAAAITSPAGVPCSPASRNGR
jgi:hypothetical protein